MAKALPLKCDDCGTEDFSVEGKAFDIGFACEQCSATMCLRCAGRYPVDGPLNAFCCYRCGSQDVRDAFNDRPRPKKRAPMDEDEGATALAYCENQMRLIVAGKVPPYDAACEIYSKAIGAVYPGSDVTHATWLIWGALADWVEQRPEETETAEATMVRAAQEWLSLTEPTERKAYLDRWVYDEMGYERPAPRSEA